MEKVPQMGMESCNECTTSLVLYIHVFDVKFWLVVFFCHIRSLESLDMIKLKMLKGSSINDVAYFFAIFDPLPPLIASNRLLDYPL